MAKQIFLKKLILRNFKGIKDLSIDFSKVTNIFGENATGKTTISDAFNWLLFDKDSKDRTTFDIKTLDKNGEVLHGLEHEVTGVLSVDGSEITLSKIYKEKWTKKRGEALKQLTGHETLYSIDDVPVKKKEYQEKINEIIDENLFKLITNPLYFSTSMKWQDRRNVLLDIIGDITDEKVINSKTNLKPLLKLLGDKDIDTLAKSIKARKKRLNDEIKSIPYRIDELNNSIQELNFEALDFRKRGVVAGIKSIEEKLLDSSKINNELLETKLKINELKHNLKELEHETILEAEKPIQQIKDELRELKFEINSKENELGYKDKEVKKLQGQIAKEQKIQEQLREQWYQEDKREFKFDEKYQVCPTCKRPYDTEDIEATREKLLENFNETIAENKKKINVEGIRLKEEIKELQNKLKDINLDNLKAEIEDLKDKKEKLKIKISNFQPKLNLENNQDYQNTLKQIEELETKVAAPTEIEHQLKELQSKRLGLEKELEDINSQLAYKEQNEKMKTRIVELQEEERELAERIAALEGQEFLCEEFIKTKVELLESSINSKFKYVSFKLFDTQVNGGINECCEALVNGVPFGNANTASQINAGLDIINALSEHYEVQAPIFIDNRESVNQLIETNSQVVNLVVSKDKALRIENNLEISEEDREYFNKKLEEIKQNIGNYSKGYIAEDIFPEAKFIKEEIGEQSRWSIQKTHIYDYKGIYFAVSWDDPATEMQDGQDTNCTVFEVKPTRKEVVEFI